MSTEALDLWYLAHADHLRCDPVPRRISDVIFEAKGYPPRDPGNIFETARMMGES